MTTFLDDVINRAQANMMTIVLPEGEDVRTLVAARRAIDNDIADVIVLGTHETIASHGVPLHHMRIIDPQHADDREELARELAKLRERKGLTYEKAYELVGDPLYYGTMLVKIGKADGLVAGACHPTSKVLLPSLQIVKTAPNTKTASSAFVMIVPDCTFGSQGRFLFADCATNEEPNPEQLASIAITSADTFRTLLGGEPRVAMLSFSTHGSAQGNPVDKVQEAVRIAHEMEPDLLLDGDLQLDAAIIPEVAATKAPESAVAGRANVLVFPSLEAGNIGYKLVERLAKAEAYGPISQGMAAPISDLSRGCTADDIVGVIAITAVQAQHAESKGWTSWQTNPRETRRL